MLETRSHDKTWYALEMSEEVIIVETDCLELVSMATNTERDNSSLGHLVVDLQNLLMSPRVLIITKIP